MDLELLQQSIIKLILGDEEHSDNIEKFVQSAGFLSASQRVNIYKNSVIGNYISILKDVYPVCHCLVGEQYFVALCQKFVARQPNHKPDITQYGDAFADFLQTFAPVQLQCAYLADMAHLEWGCRQALDSPESSLVSQRIDLKALAKIPESKQGHLVFHLPQASTLLSSRYPILDIWKSNQPDFCGSKEIDLGEAGDRLIIFRQEWSLLIQRVETKVYEMLSMLSRGVTFERVSTLLLERYETINIPEVFKECVQKGWVVGFDLVEETEK